MGNAIKFSDPSKTHEPVQVIIRAYSEVDCVCLAVVDFGRGIPAHELEHISESFYQIDREKYEDQGAGAGLAIANGVIQLHGGTLSIQSVFGEGSTFALRLPVVAPDEANHQN